MWIDVCLLNKSFKYERHWGYQYDDMEGAHVFGFWYFEIWFKL